MNFHNLKIFPKLTNSPSLQGKILGLLGLFFIFAFTIITLSLYLARQLEGNGAAINDVGSLRMRSYAIGLHLHQYYFAEQKFQQIEQEKIKNINNEFVNTLNRLQKGDIERPLFLPQNKNIQNQMEDLVNIWHHEIAEKISVLLTQTRSNQEVVNSLTNLTSELDNYVIKIDSLVLAVEQVNAKYTRQLYFFQNTLVAFSLFGTLILAYLFTRLISEPVKDLTFRMSEMSNAQFDVRVQVKSNDEIGQLANGFNRMADQLQNFYNTLEQRVIEKTASIAIKNKELSTLYETTAFISKVNQLENVCQGVLEMLLNFLQADAGVVRLLDNFSSVDEQKLRIIAQSGMSKQFLQIEEKIVVGECICGKSAQQCLSKVAIIENEFNIKIKEQAINETITPISNCSKYSLVTAIPLHLHQRSIGIFTIFFINNRQLSENEIKLVETVGSHLAISLDNLRLINYAKELAIYEERNMLAQELHDSIAQSLAFLNIQAQMLTSSLEKQDYQLAEQELNKIKLAIKESYDMVRELLSHFRLRIQQDGLDTALSAALSKFQQQTGLDCQFESLGVHSPPACAGTIQLLHVVQEALSNIRKHAKAKKVELKLNIEENGRVQIEIKDDGRGFNLDEVLEKDGFHVGLSIMRERINRLKGNIEFNTKINQGCIIKIDLPNFFNDDTLINRQMPQFSS